MNEKQFVRARMADWQQLRQLVELAARAGLGSLSGDDVQKLARLYRSATADLATARTLGLSNDTVSHVNRLCAAAHDIVYSKRGDRGFRATVVPFLLHGFPALVRRTWGFHVAAAAVFLVSAIAAYALMIGDPELADSTLGTEMRHRALRAAALETTGNRYVDIATAARPVFGWGIIANNVSVTLKVFAGGTLFVIPGVLLLIVNGVMLGGGEAVFVSEGVGDVLLTWVAAHGPFELTAIFIGAGAGMRVGLSPLVPGRLSRGESFKRCARESVGLLIGTTAMLIVAGLLEGFVSPTDLPPPVKWAVGGVTILLMVAYFWPRRAPGAAGLPPSP